MVNAPVFHVMQGRPWIAVSATSTATIPAIGTCKVSFKRSGASQTDLLHSNTYLIFGTIDHRETNFKRFRSNVNYSSPWSYVHYLLYVHDCLSRLQLGRVFHYTFDAILVSAFLAGVKRSTGLTYVLSVSFSCATSPAAISKTSTQAIHKQGPQPD